jgi:serine/threonine-protein kinase
VKVDPGSGESVRVGSTVVVSYSRGNQKVVPDLTGRTELEARSAWESAGFNAGNLTVQKQGVSDPAQVGRVVRQSVRANSAVGDNERITITIGELLPPSKSAPPSPSVSASSSPAAP